tara:strand:+ start:1209 stop:2363 length:1155 start_codon:yes stop_codon:yes gene_type:complete
MDNIIHHEVLPDNNVGTWNEYNNIDFTLDFDNRSLIANSIRFECDVQVFSNKSTDTRVSTTDDVHLDPLIGGHAFIQSAVTTFGSGNFAGVRENLVEYNRLVKMRAVAQNVPDDMNNSIFVSELRAPNKSIGQLQLLQKVPKVFGSTAEIVVGEAPSMSDPDVSIKPLISLNQVSDNMNISYDQTGTIRIGFILERNAGVLNGSTVTSGWSYELTNCRLTYRSTTTQQVQPFTMHTSLCLKSSLTSTFNNVSSRVPAVSDAVSVSFLQQSKEYDVNSMNTQLEEPPQISNLGYLFNDSSNKFITFQLKDKSEMIKRGLESLDSMGSNSMQLSNLSANESFIVGLKWNQPVDLSNTKFNIQINSGISNNNSYIMYQYFHSVQVIQ